MSKDEINRLLAEKVMGWRVGPMGLYMTESGFPLSYAHDWTQMAGDEILWSPYDNIAQAMMVADKVIAMGYHFELKYNNYDGKFAWSAAFDESDTWGFQQINSTSACEAICLAALKVVEND